MADKDNVIKGLELLHDRLLDAAKRDAIAMLDASMVADAIVLLKEQEPKTIFGIADSIEGIEVGKCPRCDRTILSKQSDPTWFCKYCGQAVRFE